MRASLLLPYRLVLAVALLLLVWRGVRLCRVGEEERAGYRKLLASPLTSPQGEEATLHKRQRHPYRELVTGSSLPRKRLLLSAERAELLYAKGREISEVMEGVTCWIQEEIEGGHCRLLHLDAEEARYSHATHQLQAESASVERFLAPLAPLPPNRASVEPLLRGRASALTLTLMSPTPQLQLQSAISENAPR